jgi:hypothetical protein
MIVDDNYSRRLQYSNGQLLAVEDFKAEQKYHVDMRRRHNRLAHTWGILEGLDIEHAQGGMELVIKPGTAIDKDGQEIVLLGPNSEPVELKDKTSLRGTTFFLGLAYHDKDDPDKGPRDKDGNQIYSTRTVEKPSIEITAAAPATDGSVITLAKVTVDANGKVVTIDKSVRSRFAGLNPATDLSVRSLSLGGDTAAPEEPLQIGKYGIDKNCFITLCSGGGKYGGIRLRSWDWGYGFTIQHQNSPMGLNIVRHQKSGDGASALFITRDTGNVGIGTPSPGAKLEVAVDASDADTKPLVVGKGTTNYLTILNNGNVGIGTTNPTADLQFRDLVANSNVLICRKAAKQHDEGNVPSELALGTIDSCFAGVRIRSERKGAAGNSQYICFETHDAKASFGERMRITPAGNVGIGTAGPQGRLEVSDPAQARAKGTITSSDKTVTGSETEFDTQLRVGDQIMAAGQARVITAITGATLTIDSAFSPDITKATAFTFSRPLLLVKDGNVGIGTTTPLSKLHIDKGRVDITTSDAPAPGGGKNRFDGLLGWNANAAYRRGQLVVSSSYSDLVIASSHDNNIHGSTLTFATSNPTDATDYRKWVINQGNWGTRKQFLDFGYSDAKGRANPHDNINSNDTVFTLDGVNKRVGIGTGTPGATLQIGETISHRNNYDLSTSKLLVRAKDHNGGSAPAATQSALALVREGVPDQAYGNMVDFRLGRWEHAAGFPSRTQLDIYLTEDAFVPKHVMSLRANGNVGIGTATPGAKLEVLGEMKASSLRIGTGVAVDRFDDSTLGDSSSTVPTAKAIKTYVDTQIADLRRQFSNHVHPYGFSQMDNLLDAPRAWKTSVTGKPQ